MLGIIIKNNVLLIIFPFRPQFHGHEVVEGKKLGAETRYLRRRGAGALRKARGTPLARDVVPEPFAGDEGYRRELRV